MAIKIEATKMKTCFERIIFILHHKFYCENGLDINFSVTCTNYIIIIILDARIFETYSYYFSFLITCFMMIVYNKIFYKNTAREKRELL